MTTQALTIQNINLPKEYGVTEAKIAELARKYADVTEIKDTATMQMAIAGRREHRELRVAVEHKRKELKADALEFGRRVDGEAKRITAELVKTESRLDDLIKAEEARKEEERQAKLRAIAEAEAKERARVDGIKAKIDKEYGPTATLALHDMDATQLTAILESDPGSFERFEEFAEEAAACRQAFIAKAQEICLQKIAAAQEAERQRIEAERLAEERRLFEEEQRIAREKAQAEEEARQERLRQEQAERDRIEAERQAVLRKEREEAERIEAERQAKLRAEQEKLEAERRKVREEQEAFEAEKRRIEEERLARERAEQEARDRAEFEERTRLQAEKEAAEKKEREEKERLAHEAAEKRRREENTRIRNKTKKDAVAAMVALNISEETAGYLFDAIDAGQIPKVSVHY